MPDGTLRERVIQLTNDYKREVFNGDLGIIQSIDTTEQEMVVGIGDRIVTYDYADLNEIALAWSISIHKSQGSEYPVVILPLFMQHYSNAESEPALYQIDQGEEIGNCGWKRLKPYPLLFATKVSDVIRNCKRNLLNFGAGRNTGQNSPMFGDQQGSFRAIALRARQ